MDFDDRRRDLFRRGSRTFYHSSLLFPEPVRRDVAILYAFVRTADDLVDEPPVRPEAFLEFRTRWRVAQEGTPAGDWIIDPFVDLARRKGFDLRWTEDFLAAMEGDLDPKPFDSMEEVLRYTWGSAETIGLFMARILGLPEKAGPAAVLMGRSFQFINILRDMAEDRLLGRRYLPLGSSGLPDLSPESVRDAPEKFRSFVCNQTTFYRGWQKAAQAGYGYLPWKYRVAIKTASDLYNWTAEVIRADPMVVWTRKVKPTKFRILRTALANLFFFPRRNP